MYQFPKDRDVFATIDKGEAIEESAMPIKASEVVNFLTKFIAKYGDMPMVLWDESQIEHPQLGYIGVEETEEGQTVVILAEG